MPSPTFQIHLKQPLTPPPHHENPTQQPHPQSFINGETNIPADEAFINAVNNYLEVFLKSDRIIR